ncbi:MAG: glycosyltransferase [Flavobacteriales bacterium]|nr:glycosyltransferase [Flavobacteriales bacterium]
MDVGLLLLFLFVGFSLINYLFLSIVSRAKQAAVEESVDISVSVIVAAHNESENLKRHLPHILSQDYENFELIVIDDNSTDDTANVLERLCKSHGNLKYARLADVRGKKNAVTKGVELAKYEWLLLTDADCWPSSDKWIESMFAHLSSNTNLILGYSPFYKSSGLVNALARVDAFIIGVQYLSFALYGIPYMGVGRNLAYRKSLFHQTGGFGNHLNVLSGDDDLFVQDAASFSHTAVRMSRDAQTISKSKSSFNSWFSQKRRHSSTGFYYKTATLITLGLIQINILGFYTALILNIIHGTHIWAVGVLVLIRFYSQYFVLKKIALKLGEIDLLLLSLILEFPIIIFNLLAGFSNILYKNRRWN